MFSFLLYLSRSALWKARSQTLKMSSYYCYTCSAQLLNLTRLPFALPQPKHQCQWRVSSPRAHYRFIHSSCRVPGRDTNGDDYQDRRWLLSSRRPAWIYECLGVRGKTLPAFAANHIARLNKQKGVHVTRTQQQQSPESPTWHASNYKVHKLHLKSTTLKMRRTVLTLQRYAAAFCHREIGIAKTVNDYLA